MQPIVIRFGRLGDMLLLAPLLQRLHRGYGEACVLLGTGPWSAPLYQAHPDVARVLQVRARHQPLAFSPERWRMLLTLQHATHAAVHVCETEPRALAKIRRMLALAHVPRERCVFAADTPPLHAEHWIDRLLRTAGRPPAACLPGWREPAAADALAPRLALTADDRRDRDAWLRARGWHGEPLWLVQPANKRSMRWNGPRADDDKAWPIPNWSAALRALHSEHPAARILACGTPNELPLLEQLAAATRPAPVDVVARDLSLRRLLALAEIADGMLSVDTGPAHLAAAMGCPLVVLFGAQAPAVWCPRSPTGSAVLALGGPPQHARVADITPDEVIAALRRLPPRSPELPRAA